LIAKALEVQQVNMAEFSNDASIVNASMLITGKIDSPYTGFIQFGRALSNNPQPDLVSRVTSIEEGLHHLVPIGAVIDWYRPSLQTPLPKNFAICDGSRIEDKASEMYGVEVPNLYDKFTMGVPIERNGEVGGNNKIPVDGKHNHTGETGDMQGFRNQQFMASHGLGQDQNHKHAILDGGDHDHGGDNRPAYVGVIKIIRVR
jgi:hypothetical protein